MSMKKIKSITEIRNENLKFIENLPKSRSDHLARLIKDYWWCFKHKHYTDCIYSMSILNYYNNDSITAEMFDKALEFKVFRLCERIIEYIDISLITIEMYDRAFKAKAFMLCQAIIRRIDQTVITTEMFDKALEAGAFDLCETILLYIGKELATEDMYNKFKKRHYKEHIKNKAWYRTLFRTIKRIYNKEHTGEVLMLAFLLIAFLLLCKVTWDVTDIYKYIN